jgi:putative ABC transport system ATP-binding protein
MLVVSCQGVTKSYGVGGGEVLALTGIDLEVKKGELVMLVGPSGCGKTTLISIIAGILDYDSGSCSVFNQDWKKLSARQRAELRQRQLGFVFQSYNLIPTLSVVENVSIPSLIGGAPKAQAEQQAALLLEQVGLADKAKAFPRQLSGGQQQRVAIARALIHNPGLIVCDEPTSALDYANGVKVMELFRSIVMQGDRSLIVVTHDQRIFHFADRLAVMDDGVVVSVKQGPFEPVSY